MSAATADAAVARGCNKEMPQNCSSNETRWSERPRQWDDVVVSVGGGADREPNEERQGSRGQDRPKARID
eukprot:9808945-Alexandrium_andersonii.AAC.1